MHYENLIAVGDQPVLVDVETLFHPSHTPVGSLEPTTRRTRTRSSVYRTALLPLLVSGEHGVADMSGLGGDAGGTRPWTWSTGRTPAWTRCTWSGGRAGRRRRRIGRCSTAPSSSRVITRSLCSQGFGPRTKRSLGSREELIGPDGMLARCAADQIRFVPRNTSLYTGAAGRVDAPGRTARRGRPQPNCSTCCGTRDESRDQVVPYELADLWAGDVPLFTARPDSRDVWASDGTRMPDVLPPRAWPRSRRRSRAWAKWTSTGRSG